MIGELQIVFGFEPKKLNARVNTLLTRGAAATGTLRESVESILSRACESQVSQRPCRLKATAARQSAHHQFFGFTCALPCLDPFIGTLRIRGIGN
jgi:hypothetical protein